MSRRYKLKCDRRNYKKKSYIVAQTIVGLLGRSHAAVPTFEELPAMQFKGHLLQLCGDEKIKKKSDI